MSGLPNTPTCCFLAQIDSARQRTASERAKQRRDGREHCPRRRPTKTNCSTHRNPRIIYGQRHEDPADYVNKNQERAQTQSRLGAPKFALISKLARFSSSFRSVLVRSMVSLRAPDGSVRSGRSAS